ncbi:hypothetical protein DFH28DRAFT_1187082 [Melampsora americana]|nr:hypothetical protein DFH28DRAFT_1187082 [Melampsora americana]
MKFIELSQKAGFNVLSMGSDGAASELSAQQMLHNLATKYLEFRAPDHDLHIKIPLLGKKLHPLVMVQDPKHAQKTAANQLLSGARFISFGSYHVGIPQLAKIVQSNKSTLYIKDVSNTNKQDDGRAYQVLCLETLQLALEHPECTGFAIYLFILGELCNSWLSQTASIQDRVISAFTSISRQSFKIMKQMVTSLLALIISHRKYYPDVPLMFWKHGTESYAHQNAPKIFTVAKHIVEGKVKMPKSEHIHAGYQNAFQDSFFKTKEFMSGLMCFPSDIQLRSLIDIAKKRATSLIQFTGIAKRNNHLSDNTNLLLPKHKNPEETHFEDKDILAAQLVEDHQQLNFELAALDLNSDKTENLKISASRISITNLLNPDVSSLHASNTQSNWTSEKAGNLLDKSQNLNPNVLVLIRKCHDSEAAKGKGNERKKKNYLQEIVASDHADPNGTMKLDPQTCSKLVAVMLKNLEQMDKTLDRLHQWNIHVKLDLNWIAKNTSTTLDIATQTLYTSGDVSEDNPLEMLFLGKICALYIYQNGKHEWITKSSTWSKLSYASTQLYRYEGNPGAYGFEENYPNRLIFCHLDIADIHYVFPHTSSMNITEPEANTVWIPQAYCSMLKAMSQKQYIREVLDQLVVEHTRAQKK